ncbi:sacsin N-terminal ATP-binding-like domain-containing protein [Kineococcus sp. SYSU DK003]|uniref:sacsin N-terminal ATP-binding-like domain-containing protein n=1 Tax=Kineococcus sp. SYSU DK003 TaxID=3383124 RepID=UPI003D7ECB1F
MQGRLRLTLREDPDGGPGRLLAANTGAPLSAAGVQALASLRASAKRDPDQPSVGRFGVGFAAVLAVTDDPALRSATGTVRFSRADSAELVRTAGSAGATAELAARDGHVAALRLPFPAPHAPAVPAGYDTVVDLPLRDAAARTLVEALLADLLAGTGDVLLLALPALTEIVVDLPGRPAQRIADLADRWRVLRRTGRFAPADLADRGVEDRRRPGWTLTWALPVGGSGVGTVVRRWRRVRTDPHRRGPAVAGVAGGHVPARPGPAPDRPGPGDRGAPRRRRRRLRRPAGRGGRRGRGRPEAAAVRRGGRPGRRRTAPQGPGPGP